MAPLGGGPRAGGGLSRCSVSLVNTETVSEHAFGQVGQNSRGNSYGFRAVDGLEFRMTKPRKAIEPSDPEVARAKEALLKERADGAAQGLPTTRLSKMPYALRPRACEPSGLPGRQPGGPKEIAVTSPVQYRPAGG